MENSFGGAGDLVAVADRLEALNAVLANVRSALSCVDDKTEGLVDQCSSLERDLGALGSHQQEIELLREQLADIRLELNREREGQDDQGADVALRIEELNALMDAIRSTITVELGAVRSRLGILESDSSVDKTDLISERLDRLQQQLESQVALFEQQSLTLKRMQETSFGEGGLSPRDILPQLDELRAHQESLESQVHGIGEAERAPWAQELHERQGDHQVRLQKLESSKEGLGLRFEKLESAQLGLGKLKDRLANEEVALGALRSDVEELMAHQTKGETEALFLRLGELESVLLSLKTRLSGGVQLSLDTMERRLSDLELFQVNQDQRSQALDSKLEAWFTASAEKLSDSSAAMEEGLRESLSCVEADLSAFREKVGSHQLAADGFAAAARSDVDELKKAVKSDHDRLEQLGEQYAGIDDRIRHHLGVREEEFRSELAVAQQSSAGERELVREQLSKISDGQQEVLVLKEELESRRGENDELRSSLRRLNDDLFEVRSESVRQKKVFFSGMAAALMMSVGLSTYMSRPSVPVARDSMLAISSLEVPQVLEPTTQVEPEWMPLEAPTIDEPEDSAVDVLLEDSAPSSSGTAPVSPSASSYAIQMSPAEATMETRSENKVNYTVQEGDSLWKIAKKHKGKVGVMERIEKIKRDNELNDANLKPGQLLSIYL